MNRELFENRKKTIYALICDEHYVPMRAREIAMLLNLTKEEREDLALVLEALVAEGKIELSKRGKYSKGVQKFFRGEFTANERGFGFVTVEGQPEDFFISDSNTGGAFHKDIVEIMLVPSSGKRREGKVVKIVEHGLKEIVGTYQASSANFGFVIPDDPKIATDIFIQSQMSMRAVDGHKVVAEIISYGKPGKKPEGRIVEILGHVNDPGTDILSIVRAYGLPEEFPERVLNQAIRVSNPVTEADMAGRMDLRNIQTVTIDGEDAKDLDDAVTLRKDGELYELGVHIADVTNYVQEHSALDVEALKRGTSVYLVDRVIPMLPHALSNGICSLNQGEDRLALSCIMKINNKGDIVDHIITESVINVDRRMSYTNVNKIITDKDPAVTAEYAEFTEMFFLMKEVADILRHKRKIRGSIDFDFPETKVILDSDGHPVEIKPYDRNAATKIIEDFMLAANETVAAEYFWREIPFLYRTHDNPDPEKIKGLSTFINNFGFHIHVGSDEIHPKELQKLLEKIEGTDAENLISRITLRSMKQAKYTPECTGHFGLAAKYYCHFTSPIRRYPDLQIHRIIKDDLRGRLNGSRVEHYEKIMNDVAVNTSKLERRAEEAERETVKLKKVEYMEQFVGATFEGVISGVTKYGIYVELENTCEGMVHVSTIPGDYYEFNEDRYEMAGERTGRTYKLGQKVMVRVAGTDKVVRRIDFELVK